MALFFKCLAELFITRATAQISFSKIISSKTKKWLSSAFEDWIDVLPLHPIVRTSQNDFEWMQAYIDDPDFLGRQICASH
jgi:hypothetical protein